MIAMTDKQSKLDQLVVKRNEKSDVHRRREQEADQKWSDDVADKLSRMKLRVSVSDDEHGATLRIHMGPLAFLYWIDCTVFIVFFVFYLLVEFAFHQFGNQYAFYIGILAFVCFFAVMSLYQSRSFNIFISRRRQFNVYRNRFDHPLAVGELSDALDKGLHLETRRLFPVPSPIYRRLKIFAEPVGDSGMQEIAEIKYLSVKDAEVIAEFKEKYGC